MSRTDFQIVPKLTVGDCSEALATLSSFTYCFSCFFQTNKQSSLQDIFDKIRVAVHKNGIRTTEFFKDHDKLRSGVITENQVSF